MNLTSHSWRTTAYANPYLLLTLAALFFAGNTVAGRLAVDNISPYQLVLLRWVMVVGALSIIMRHRMTHAWQKAKGKLRWIFLLGFTGYTSFNTLFYVAAERTGAINLGIIQGTIPIWILIGGLVLFRAAVSGLQVFGVILAVLGVAILTTKGEWAALAALMFNSGDLLMLLACCCFAAYTLGLRKKPPVEGLEFFVMMALAAAVSSAPLAAYEILSGDAYFPTLQGWLVLLYVAIFPSFLSQVFYIRGVELIGPARAGVFLNLVPVFAVFCAVLIIDEELQWIQTLSLLFVIIGIVLSEKSGAAARSKKLS